MIKGCEESFPQQLPFAIGYRREVVMMKNYVNPNNQTGVVLIVSLIMLLLLTIIGLTGTQVSSLEEKMASNSRDQNIAFQAAEAALRGAEDQLETIVALGAFDGDDGLLGEDDAKYDYSLSSTWYSDDKSIEFVSGITQVTTQPRYFIKFVSTGDDDSSASINLGGYGDSTTGGAVSFFSITARGTGGQDSSQVFLRSNYGKRF